MKIEATTLQEAITKAAGELGCSVIDLDIKVIQHPSRGILGFFKKNAIIEARSEKDIQKKSGQKNTTKNEKRESKSNENKKGESTKQSSNQNKNDRKKEPRNNQQNIKSQEQKQEKSETKIAEQKQQPKKDEIKSSNKRKKSQPRAKTPTQPRVKVDIETVLLEIEDGLKRLFESNCFEIDRIEVSKLDSDTVFMKIDGGDAALLIGKDGYRYKAFSYLLHNWINLKYGLSIRLEISEFLKNQEEMISKYLQDIIAKAKESGKAQTKPLDGILVKIALNQLRAEFPDKYVRIRSSRHGKFIVIGESKKSNE